MTAKQLWARFWGLRWRWKGPIMGVVALAVVLVAIPNADEDEPGSPADIQTTASASRVKYEEVQTWTIPNGGKGRLIVISPDHLNAADSAALGEKLKSDFRGDRNSVVQVFTDKKAAQVRDAVVANRASAEDVALYDRSLVGDYTKNASTGFHEYTICFGGFVRQVDCHTTKY